MKKILITLLVAVSMIFPVCVNAQMEVLDFKETLEEEGIKLADSGYKETDDQIIIYFFRGSGCSHCYDFLKYLNSISKEYGYMFKVRSYETYGNSDNKLMKQKVAPFFEEEAKGVPYIIIGRSSFYGFAEEKHGEKVLAAIKAEYEATEKYDVIEEINKKETDPEAEKDSNKNSNSLLAIVIPIVGCVLIYLIFRAAKMEK